MNREDAYTITKDMVDNAIMAGDLIASAATVVGFHKSDAQEIADDCFTLLGFLIKNGPLEWWTEEGVEDVLEARIEYNSVIDELAENFADIVRCLRVSIPD